MSPLERKRLEAELMRVKSARYDLELKILEREEDIKRLKDHIAIQIAKEKELTEKVSQLEDT